MNSDFEREQIYEIITSGLKGFENKIARRLRNKENFYRKGKDTLEERTRKKLTEKTSWFQKKKKKEKEKFKRQKSEKRAENLLSGAETAGAKAVITVPHTWGGTLAKLMRLKEDELFKLTGYRLKITERVGPSLKSQLVKSDPWAGRDCDREDCLLCISKLRSGKNLTQNCHKRNAVYETWCESCRVRDEAEAENDKNNGKSDLLPPPGPSVGGGKGENDKNK